MAIPHFFLNEDELTQTHRQIKHHMNESKWWQTLQFVPSLISLLAFKCLILVLSF